jgi:hypothetical protein
MVAHSFQSRFAEPVLDGSKDGTIGADRRRHARPGEQLQIYVGMRTKQCRLITRKICVAINPSSSCNITGQSVVGTRWRPNKRNGPQAI